jgi:hypothetical protein
MSTNTRDTVVPAKAGTQLFDPAKGKELDPGLRRDDDREGFAR